MTPLRISQLNSQNIVYKGEKKKKHKYESTEGVKTPLKMDLVGSLHWKHLPCQSIKMIISEDNSETVRTAKKMQTRLSKVTEVSKGRAK